MVKSRKPIQTKFRMPLLNWQALKPNQVSGTVFNELDDEQVLGVRTYILYFIQTAEIISRQKAEIILFLSFPPSRFYFTYIRS